MPVAVAVCGSLPTLATVNRFGRVEWAAGRRDGRPRAKERASQRRPIESRNVDRTSARICTDNGLRRIRLHDLRHTTATMLKALGVPPKDAQVILGHAHITTTNQIYTHVDEPAKREALSKLNRLVSGDDR